VPECTADATDPCWVGVIDESLCTLGDHFYIEILNNTNQWEPPTLALCTIPDCDQCFEGS
jgi:hypothetical protein